MKDFIPQLLEQYIKLELNVSKLYQLFYELSPEDASFWWELSLEEGNHASLLETGKLYFVPMNKFPESLLYDSMEDVIKANNDISKIIAECKETPPSRAEMFQIAIDLESDATEMHYQVFMSESPHSEEQSIFQKLNKEDKNHIEQLIAYMTENGIPLLE